MSPVFQMLLPALHHFLGSTAKGGSLARAVRNDFFGDVVEGMEDVVEGMEVGLGGSEEKTVGD
jgi:hypothetical protein